MHPTQWLVCSGRPEGRLLSCLGPLLKVYFASVCGFYPSTSQCSGRTVPGKAWSHRQVLEGCQKFESSWDLSIFKVGLQRGETLAWIRAQGSHHTLLQSGGEPASTTSEEAGPALALLCPVKALCKYMDCTKSFRISEQLLVCCGGQQKG